MHADKRCCRAGKLCAIIAVIESDEVFDAKTFPAGRSHRGGDSVLFLVKISMIASMMMSQSARS